MKFSLKFIKEFVDVRIKPSDLAERLTMAGMEVEAFQQEGDDWVFDIEVTTNRYDWLSMAGIAREVAAIQEAPFSLKDPLELRKKSLSKRKIIIQDHRDCSYYVGQLISAVTVGVAAESLAAKVSLCGIHCVNDVVDIGNYCMLKWGNPLHVFDDDKIEGDIYIRRAKKGESFLGIDEKEYDLSEANLVVADSVKIIALAGVMGAKNTEVGSDTKNVFLEAAIFSPLAVRRSRRLAGVSTESSYRFERMVNPLHLEYAASEAAALIEKKAKGVFQGIVKAGRNSKSHPPGVSINIDHLNQYLGASFPPAAVGKVFKNLGCEVKTASKGNLKVFGPQQRFDLNREVDYYEEFARIYGYDKILPQIPFLGDVIRKNLTPKGGQNFYHFKKDVRSYLSRLGCNEIVTFSVEGEDELLACGEKDPIILVNPLRKQENAMRTTLLLGMLKSLRHNLNRGQEELRLFEVADIYHKNKKGFIEEPAVAIGFSGSLRDFYELKGVVESFLEFLNIKSISYSETKRNNFSNAIEITAKEVSLGFLGKLDSRAKNYYDMRQDFFYAQLDVSALDKARGKKKYEAFSPYPPVCRDISLRLKRGVTFKTIEKIIRDHGRFISDIQVVDVYKRASTLEEDSIFTLRLFYQSAVKTLTAAEVDSFHDVIRQALAECQGVALR
jgi:phenylalanyl-tRNA synthetase beta chain